MTPARVFPGRGHRLGYLLGADALPASLRCALIGLGMWEAEGYRHPKQIPEWVEKAARQGSEPNQAMAAADLLLEGQSRYQQYLVRREVTPLSKADVRRVQSARAISRFLQGQG